jgi:hypothetical protein
VGLPRPIALYVAARSCLFVISARATHFGDACVTPVDEGCKGLSMGSPVLLLPRMARHLIFSSDPGKRSTAVDADSRVAASSPRAARLGFFVVWTRRSRTRAAAIPLWLLRLNEGR